MKYKKTFPFCLMFLFLIIGFYYINSNRTKADNDRKNASTQAKKSALKTQSVELGEVTYKISPKKIKSSDKSWEFEVILDAHTGSLNQNLVSLISIVDNKNNEYQAIKWIGDPPGGHHREGTLEFLPIIPYPSSIELKIQTTTSQDFILNWNL